jgi:hypothetical protein
VPVYCVVVRFTSGEVWSEYVTTWTEKAKGDEIAVRGIPLRVASASEPRDPSYDGNLVCVPESEYAPK